MEWAFVLLSLRFIPHFLGNHVCCVSPCFFREWKIAEVFVKYSRETEMRLCFMR